MFTPQSDESVDETPTSTQSVDVKTLSELFFESLGQLRHCSDEIMNLVTGATNSAVVHYTCTSAFMEIKDTCKEILALEQQTHDKAEIKLEEITSIPDESFSTSKQETLVEHDPVRPPEKLTECQIKYLIHIGPCQPKLSAYTKNADLAKKRKQCSFCPTRYKDYPYLGYSISEDKAYCYVSSMFQRGVGREKAESAWIEGVEDWSKMK